ncbi:hypothetical protein [Ruegeria faecimaris]|uniref:hypothetical protein n=1 Tax=Ruegeria faecimaris TaxID=686389 RepID=UPI0023311B43|nr:hypothetical protein [Ruegeria faecimaris]
MPVFLLLLAAAVFAYFLWRARTSSLTRECRWRQHRKEGQWVCSFCCAQTDGAESPKQCLKGSTGG